MKSYLLGFILYKALIKLCVPYLQNEFFRRKFLSQAECYAEWKDEHNRVEVLVGGQGQAEAGEEPEFLDHAQQEQRQHQVGQN